MGAYEAMQGSKLPKIALIVLAVGFLIYLISFGSPHWAATRESKTARREHIGLWKFCSYPIGGGQVCDDFIDWIVGDWLKAAQSFMTLALFTLLGALAVVAMYAFVEDYEGDMRIIGASLALLGVSGLFLLIGVAVFGGKYGEYFKNREPAWDETVGELSWAFGLGVCSCVLVFVSLIIMVLEVAGGGME